MSDAEAPIELHHRLDGPEGAPVIAFANSLGTSLEMWDTRRPSSPGGSGSCVSTSAVTGPPP